jgi:hypothetical protein
LLRDLGELHPAIVTVREELNAVRRLWSKPSSMRRVAGDCPSADRTHCSAASSNRLRD